MSCETLDCDLWYTNLEAVIAAATTELSGPSDLEKLINVAAMRIGSFGFALKTIAGQDVRALRRLRPSVQAQVCCRVCMCVRALVRWIVRLGMHTPRFALL